MTGKVKTLRPDRAFGFILAEDGKEYFFHRSGTIAVFESLIEGAEVTFDTEPSPKGPRAVSVQCVTSLHSSDPGAAPEPAA